MGPLGDLTPGFTWIPYTPLLSRYSHAVTAPGAPLVVRGGAAFILYRSAAYGNGESYLGCRSASNLRFLVSLNSID